MFVICQQILKFIIDTVREKYTALKTDYAL